LLQTLQAIILKTEQQTRPSMDEVPAGANINNILGSGEITVTRNTPIPILAVL